MSYVTERTSRRARSRSTWTAKFKKTVSTYRDPVDGRGVQQVVYSADGLPNGSHTLRAVKRSGSFMLLDKLDVRPRAC